MYTGMVSCIPGKIIDDVDTQPDARPDFSRWSSDFRMEVSVTAGLEHIQTFIHPQIIIIDDPSREDDFFVRAVRSKVMDLDKSLIELPKDATKTMMWMTRLDSGSLAGLCHSCSSKTLLTVL